MLRMFMKLYDIESHFSGGWHKILPGVSKEWALGYLSCYRHSMPRNAMRAVSGDKVIDSVDANENVAIGMIAGWPTAEQYRHAAAKALEKADAVEAFNNKRNRA